MRSEDSIIANRCKKIVELMCDDGAHIELVRITPGHTTRYSFKVHHGCGSWEMFVDVRMGYKIINTPGSYWMVRADLA